MPVTGSQYRFGIKLEEPSNLYSVGHPMPENRVATSPAATITVTVGGDPGIVPIGDYSFAYCDVVEGGFRTALSAWVEATVPVASAQISIDATADNASPRVISKQIYGKYKAPGASGYGPEFLVADGLAPATTPAFLFTVDPTAVPPLVDYTRKPPTFNETGTNYEFHFFDPKTMVSEPDYKMIDTKQLTGTSGPRRKLPGEADYPTSWTDVTEPARVVYMLWGLMGRCTKYGLISGTWTEFAAGTTYDGPERKYVFTSSARRKTRKPGSFSLVVSPNNSDPDADYAPLYVWQNMLTDLTLTTAGGKEVTLAPKIMACGHTYHGICVQDSGTGTGRPLVLFGVRQDAHALDEKLYIKNYGALAAGFAKWRAKRSSGGSYGTTAASDLKTYADASNRHTLGNGSNVIGDVTEVFDEQTPPQSVGIDRGSNRRIVCFQCGRLDEYDLNDVFSSTIKAPFPGVYTAANPTGPSDDGTWSGVAPVLLRKSPFTDAHVLLKKGDGSADTLLEILSSSAKMAGGLKRISPHNRRAPYPSDLRPQGELTFDISFTRDYLTREFEKYMESDGRLVGQWALEGEFIWKSAGVVSIYREGIYIDCPQMAINSTKRPVSSENTIEESVTFSAEQPDNAPDDDHITATIITAQDIFVPAG